MKRFARALVALATFSIAATSLNACASQPLITPQQAQDRIYDHLSRAEAFHFSRRHKLAQAQRKRAREYKRLIAEGKTTTPQQALAKAALHLQRADAYQSKGYTRFVNAELDAAAKYEEFAVDVGCLTPTATSDRAKQHWQRAAAYDRRGLGRFAKHHRKRAQRLDSILMARSSAGEGCR